MNRILVVNANWLGDVLFSTPAIRALRKKFPESHIACLVPSRLTGLLRNNPHLNEIFSYDPKPFVFSILGSAGLIRQLKSSNFDAAVFFHASKTKVFIATLAGISRRIGFGAEPGKDGLTEVYPMPSSETHRSRVFTELVKNLGAVPDGQKPDFFPDPKAGEECSKLLEVSGIRAGEPYVVLHAGGNWDLKRWPAENFVRWIRLFHKKFSWKVILCGTSSEQSLTEEIRRQSADDRVVSLCGQTSIDTLAVLLAKTKLLISNDSGPIHLGASQNTRTLGLFGPTAEEITGPVSDGTIHILRKKVGCEVPCYFKSCDNRICLDWLTPEEVFDAAQELLRDEPR